MNAPLRRAFALRLGGDDERQGAVPVIPRVAHIELATEQRVMADEAAEADCEAALGHNGPNMAALREGRPPTMEELFGEDE